MSDSDLEFSKSRRNERKLVDRMSSRTSSDDAESAKEYGREDREDDDYYPQPDYVPPQRIDNIFEPPTDNSFEVVENAIVECLPAHTTSTCVKSKIMTRENDSFLS